MKKIYILLLLCLTAIPMWAQHSISGTVTDSHTGETLIGVTVYDTLSRKGVTTNQHGRYTITLKGNHAVLRFSFVGCEPQYFDLKLDHDQKINVQLVTSTTLQAVVIQGERAQHVESSQTSVIQLPVEQIKSVPVMFGETDVIKVVQLLPGVQNGSEGTAGMYVRGGGPDENLFLLDGVPMYNVNHLGGFFSAFNSDAIKNVQLYKGSFPARFGSRLSSVLDITTNNGNDKEYHGDVSIGAISAKVNFEGPLIKEKTTYSISARRTYLDIWTQPLIALSGQMSGDKIAAGYYFYDLNAKVTHKFNDRSRLYASFYMGDDAIYARVKTGSEYSYGKETLKLGWNWGNIVSSLRWNYELTPKLFMNVTGSFTRYRNSIGVDIKEEMTSYDESYNFSLKQALNSGIHDLTGRVDFDYAPTPDHAIKFGGGYIYHLFTPETSTLKVSETDYSPIDTTIGESRIYASEINSYIEDDWTINQRFKINAGLNITAFAVQDHIYPSIQPRFSGRMLITDNLSLKAGYAYMTQYLHLLSNSNLSLPSDLWVPVTARILPMNSQQVATGLFYNFRDSLNISVEGYYKWMNNLLEYKDGASFWGKSAQWEDKVCMGNGWAYGIEFLVQKTVGRLTGWLGYTWSHADRLFNREGQTLNGGNPFPAKYDRRHDISIVLTYKFTDRIDASVSWVFSSGNAGTLALQEFDPNDEPSTPYYDDYYGMYYSFNSVPYVSSRNNYRMPNYHRMDVSVNFHRQFRHARRTINVSVYNLYNHQNPYLIFVDGQSLVQLSVFPIIPSFSYSLHF